MEKLIEEHIKKFGKEPNIIGMFWHEPEKVAEGIIKAIDQNKPYDEYEMLSKDEQIAYNDGKLMF